MTTYAEAYWQKIDRTMLKYFGYGSLQPGAWNYPMLAPAVCNSRPARATGEIAYHAPGSYPIARFQTTPETVVGTLFELDSRNDAWLNVLIMEVNAGYRLVSIVVDTEDGQKFDALAFEYRGSFVGKDKVPDGDWLKSHLGPS